MQQQPEERKPTSFQHVTAESQRLIAGEEGTDVEFKQILKGLDPEDLVAFANSSRGGTIFIGVREVQDGHIKRGEIVGCKVGNDLKQAILSSAQSCQPTVNVTVYQEGLATPTPFFRIYIPSGSNKPYSTSKGTYKIRGDGRNQALTPDALLALFVATQAAAFVDRFRQATSELQQELQDKLSHITQRMHEFNDLSEKAMQQISGRLDDVFHAAEDAESRASDVSFTIDQAFYEVNGDIASLARRVDALLDHHSIPDPIAESEPVVVTEIVTRIAEERKKEEIKKWFLIEYPRGTPEQFERRWKEAHKLLQSRPNLRKKLKLPAIKPLTD